jgi:hypothetical protein
MWLPAFLMLFSKAVLNSKHARETPCRSPLMVIGGLIDQLVKPWLPSSKFLHIIHDHVLISFGAITSTVEQLLK